MCLSLGGVPLHAPSCQGCQHAAWAEGSCSPLQPFTACETPWLEHARMLHCLGPHSAASWRTQVQTKHPHQHTLNPKP